MNPQKFETLSTKLRFRSSFSSVYENLARLGTASQIDDWDSNMRADTAIDGNTSGRMSDRSVAVSVILNIGRISFSPPFLACMKNELLKLKIYSSLTYCNFGEE